MPQAGWEEKSQFLTKGKIVHTEKNGPQRMMRSDEISKQAVVGVPVVPELVSVGRRIRNSKQA